MPHIFISAAHKSSGKTTISIGLCAALTQKGLYVQPFKKGPDYIDPLWLALAAGHPCYNLDFFTMSVDEIDQQFYSHLQAADIGLIEGNKGLYDGLDLYGSNSNAGLATQLNSPVILVLDTRGMTRGIAPLILGYQQFEKKINIAGVILNSVGGQRHESKLRQVIEHYTDVKVIGAVARDDSLNIEERHLGLMPSNEKEDAQQRINMISHKISEGVNLDAVIKLAHQAPKLKKITAKLPFQNERTCRIGIAQDAAFGFYYAHDLEVLKAEGAEIIFFNALSDKHLPKVDALFIGGGFPEVWMAELSANKSLLKDIYQFIEDERPVYAECGGLMYLCEQIEWHGKSYPMTGVIKATVQMHQKPQGRGYVYLEQNKAVLWSPLVDKTAMIKAHEFHYSSLIGLAKNTKFAYTIKRGFGIDGKNDGIIYKNLLANYTHLKNTDTCSWAKNFIQFILKHKRCNKSLV